MAEEHHNYLGPTTPKLLERFISLFSSPEDIVGTARPAKMATDMLEDICNRTNSSEIYNLLSIATRHNVSVCTICLTATAGKKSWGLAVLPWEEYRSVDLIFNARKDPPSSSSLKLMVLLYGRAPDRAAAARIAHELRMAHIGVICAPSVMHPIGN